MLVSTPDERDQLVVRLKTVTQAVFKGKGQNIDSNLFADLPSELAEELTKISSEDQSHDYREDITQYCETAISDLENLPVISLTLSYSPNNQQAARLVKLAKTKFSSAGLVEIVQDKAILGGVIASFGGKYFDQSLANLVHQKLSEHETPST